MLQNHTNHFEINLHWWWRLNYLLRSYLQGAVLFISWELQQGSLLQNASRAYLHTRKKKHIWKRYEKAPHLDYFISKTRPPQVLNSNIQNMYAMLCLVWSHTVLNIMHVYSSVQYKKAISLCMLCHKNFIVLISKTGLFIRPCRCRRCVGGEINWMLPVTR